MKKINILNNNNDVSMTIASKLREKLLSNGFEMTSDNPELCIAVGGDGSFLRMVKAYNYNSDIVYVGINAGTLGFLQEIRTDDIDLFIDNLKNNHYLIDEVGVQHTIIETSKKTKEYYSLNEIVVREGALNTARLEVKIDDAHLENFIGDGLLIATSVGSTAYNLSFGGSIVDSNFHTLQITPIAPLNNKSYRNLLNSLIIPEFRIVELIPMMPKTNLLISIDGDNIMFEDVQQIKTFVKDKRIKCLRLKTYNFFEKINDKFLIDKEEK